MQETPQAPALRESPPPLLLAHTHVREDVLLEPAAPEARALAPVVPAKLRPPTAQETDAWWGSYSGWTMLPSMMLCVGLTGLIAWGSWRLLDKGWVQLSVLTLTGAVWFVQLFRWCYRVFGYNYRVTTQRLFQTRGMLYQEGVEVSLAAITTVTVRRGPYAILTGVGTVVLTLEDPSRGKVVLEGVACPRRVAEWIRQWCEEAREGQVTGGRV